MTKKTKKRIKNVVKILVSLLIVVALFLGTAYLVVADMLKNVEYVDPDDEDFIVSQIPQDPDDVPSDVPDTDSDIIASYETIITGDLAARLPIVKSTDKITNILLVGCDSRGLNFRGRTDTMMVITINETRRKIVITSIMRDSYVLIPTVNDKNRINASYAFGGESLLIKTIKNNIGISIDRYVTVNFAVFREFVDDLGGVDLYLEPGEFGNAYSAFLEHSVKKGRRTAEEVEALKKGGTFHATGAEALSYVRMRHTGSGDFARTERQRKFMKIMIDKFAAMPVTDIIGLLNKYLGEVRTTLSQEELMGYILKLATYLTYDMDMGRIPADGTWQYLNIGGRSMVGVDFAENLKIWNKRVYG